MVRRHVCFDSEAIYFYAADGPPGNPDKTHTGCTRPAAYWQPADRIDWRYCPTLRCWKGRNCAVRIVYATRFRRALNSITRALNSPTDPLQRIIIRFRARGAPEKMLLAIPRAQIVMNGEILE